MTALDINTASRMLKEMTEAAYRPRGRLVVSIECYTPFDSVSRFARQRLVADVLDICDGDDSNSAGACFCEDGFTPSVLTVEYVERMATGLVACIKHQHH